jgi:hypothetical protein
VLNARLSISNRTYREVLPSQLIIGWLVSMDQVLRPIVKALP